MSYVRFDIFFFLDITDIFYLVLFVLSYCNVFCMCMSSVDATAKLVVVHTTSRRYGNFSIAKTFI